MKVDGQTNRIEVQFIALEDPIVGDFVCCNLLSRHLNIARQFYHQVFDWQYETLVAADGLDYVMGANAA